MYLNHTVRCPSLSIVRISGEVRLITSYTSARVVSVSTPFSGAPMAGTTFEIFLGGDNASIPVTTAGTGASHHLKYAYATGGTPGTALWVPSEHSIVFTAIEDFPAFQMHLLAFQMYNLAAQAAPTVWVETSGGREVPPQMVASSVLNTQEPSFVTKTIGQTAPYPEFPN
ncbi:hypothetical protein T484DRAFT_1896292, partial [Baffinella frigidus]